MGDRKKDKAVMPQQPAGVMQQMQPILNQSFGQHGGKSTRLNMDGTIKDMNAPSGLDWLEAHGPDRASVQARYKRLEQELRPTGGLPWMAQQGSQAVEAHKQLQQMLPKASPSVTQRWGGDDVGAVSTAMKDGIPVGFSTNTPQAKFLHQFSPRDFVDMLGQLPKEPSALQGSAPQPGAEQFPVNTFVGQTPINNPDSFFNRDRAGVRAREQERQRHNVYKDQVQPNFMDYLGAAGDTLNTAGTELGNWIADLLGNQEQLPKITKADLPAPAFVGPPQTQLVFGPFGQVMESTVATAQRLPQPDAGTSALNWLEQLPGKAQSAYDGLGGDAPSWVLDLGANLGSGPLTKATGLPVRDLLPKGANTFIRPSVEPRLANELESLLGYTPVGPLVKGKMQPLVRKWNSASSPLDFLP